MKFFILIEIRFKTFEMCLLMITICLLVVSVFRDFNELGTVIYLFNF